MSVKIGNIDLGDFPKAMEDVSDPPFILCKTWWDMMFTEFISSEV